MSQLNLCRRCQRHLGILKSDSSFLLLKCFPQRFDFLNESTIKYLCTAAKSLNEKKQSNDKTFSHTILLPKCGLPAKQTYSRELEIQNVSCEWLNF